MEYLGEIISGLSALGVAFIGVQGARHNKRQQADKERSERQAQLRAKESQLSMQMVSAAVGLGVATALAVKGHKINGEMDGALKEADTAKKEYYKFINKTAAEEIAAG